MRSAISLSIDKGGRLNGSLIGLKKLSGWNVGGLLIVDMSVASDR